LGTFSFSTSLVKKKKKKKTKFKLGELRIVAGVSQWTIATRCSLQDSHLMFLQNCNSIFPLNTFAQARICRQARLGYYNKKNVTRKQTASELLFFIIKKNGR
jgi:hypothetical protein